jgi:hypothetical protein
MKNKPMTEKRYRLQRPDEVTLSGDLANAFQVPVDCGDTPADPRCPAGRWYCGNPGCSVRPVTIGAEYPGRTPAEPPVMKCPECGEPMRFESYLAEVLLLPVEEDNDFLPA